MRAGITAKSAIRDRQLRNLAFAQLASSVGDFLVLTSLLFAIQWMDGTRGQFGLALAVEAMTFVVMLIVGGLAGDRLCGRSVMVGADLLRFGTQGVLAVLLISGRAQFWELLIAQAALGAGAAFFTPAAQALIPRVAPPHLVQPANALRGMAMSIGGGVGPAIAAVILAVASPGWAFALDSISFLLSAALLMSIRAPRKTTEAHEWLVRALISGWTEFRSRTWVWVVVVEFALVNALALAPFFVLGPAVAAESFGGPSAWAGILFALSVGELLGGFVAISWWPKRPLLVGIAGMGWWAIPALLLAGLAPLGLILLTAIFAGASIALFAALWHTAMQTHIPAEYRARLSSYDLLGSLGLMPLGYLLGGILLASVGPTVGLLAGACVVVLATAATLAVPSVRQLGSAPLLDHRRAQNPLVQGVDGPATAAGYERGKGAEQCSRKVARVA
jgi:predicted MFS family arabinose efflux permease